MKRLAYAAAGFVIVQRLAVLPLPGAWQPGLLGGTLSDTAINLTVYPASTAPFPDPHVATSYVASTSSSTEPWKQNQTWVYTGQFRSEGTNYVFASKIDERCYLRIGASVLLPGTANNAFAVSVVTNIPAGWHPFEIRLFNSTGAAGPSANVGLANKIGFGYNTNDYTGTTGANYTYPADNGGMSIFRYDDGLGFADELLVAGDPGNYGTVEPPYGITNGLAPSSTFDCSAPADFINVEPGMRARCVGYALYTNTTAAPMLLSSGATNEFTYTHDRWAKLVWEWERRYLVNIATGPGGTVSTNGGWYDEGSNVTATASADAGAGFANWSGDVPDGQQFNPTLSFAADMPRNLMANFTGTVWQAGLRAGAVPGHQNYSGIPGVSYVQPGPHIVTNRNVDLVPLNTTWAYQGQIYLNGGPYRFGCAMNTYVYLRIGGNVILAAYYDNKVSAVVEYPAGWYDFDLRLSHHYTTGLPSGVNNWPLTLGFGITTNRDATSSGIYFEYPEDPGDMTLFRCAAGPAPAAGSLLVRGGYGYDGTPNLPAPYLIAPLAPGDTMTLTAPTNHFNATTKKFVRCIGYDLFTNGVPKSSGSGTSLTYTHTDDNPELVWKWRRDLLTTRWIKAAGGDFLDPVNWDPGIIPGSTDTAVFDLPSPPYTVTWSGNSTSLYFKVNAGTVTWDLQGHSYIYENKFTTEYGVLSGDCTIGTASTPVEMLITNGTINRRVFEVKWAQIQGPGTRLRVHDAKLSLMYLSVGADTLVHVSGPSALFQSYGYTGAIYGTILSTNGALHDTREGTKLRSTGRCVLDVASGGQTHQIAFSQTDDGSELWLINGAKAQSNYAASRQIVSINNRLVLTGGATLTDAYSTGPLSWVSALCLNATAEMDVDGTVQFSQLLNVAGRLVPGGDNAIGTFRVNGAVTNHTAGRIAIELAGRDAGEYDRLMVRNGAVAVRPADNGSLNLLGGTLEVTAINGFKPVYRDAFQILDCNAINGTFDTVSLPGGNERWDTSELYSAGIIRYALPPGTLFFVQ